MTFLQHFISTANRKKFLFVLVFFTSVSSYCQPKINWSFHLQRNNDSAYTLQATAPLANGWYAYGVNKKIDGLSPASFAFDYENVKPVGDVNYASKAITINDAIWQQLVTAYQDDISFSQSIIISGAKPPQLKGTASLSLAKGTEFYTIEQPFSVAVEGADKTESNLSPIKLTTVDIKKPLADCGQKNEASESLLTVFFLGFVGGLIALLTPCVFPMIPVTVSFFTKRSPSRKTGIRNGLLYGFFIFLIYVAISIPFHVIGNVNAQIFNTIATNAWLNLLFFIVFVVFAISFFGFFEISLPNSIANKADEKSDLSSIGGIFFMALTLTIVSFSCTGIILGSLLVGEVSNGAWPLTYGLAGFGVALGLPFALFAIFPSLLASLPKSGGWLDTVKKVLAFVEIALAFKFLSSADLVMHWGLLKREVFVAIWVLTGLGLSLYLFGILRLPHDYKGQKISVGRKIFGVMALLFTLYLVPGVTQSKSANLNLVSGILPPLSYSIYGKQNIKGKTIEANVMNDFDKAVALAKLQNKPLLIDFTGWACTNCRRMEENVWSKPEVSKYIQDNFILVSLYVDDREKLPVLQRTTYKKSNGSEIDITTNGDKWSTFEVENFAQSSQPLYVILNTNGQLVNHPVGYTPDAKQYLSWLSCGKETFGKK